MDENLLEQLELFVSCRNLPKLDLLSKSDPFVVAYTLENYQSKQIDQNRVNKPVEIWRSEVIKDNLNPNFTKQLRVTYYFEQNQMFLFHVYDSDSSSTDLKKHDFIGSAQILLSELVTATNQTRTLKLNMKRKKKNENDNTPTITLRCEECSKNQDSVRIQFSGRNLAAMDIGCCGFGRRSDPYIEIKRCREDGSQISVARTNVSNRNLNPNQKPLFCRVQALCNGDYDRPLKLVCYDQNHNNDPDLIGECQTTLREIEKFCSNNNSVSQSKFSKDLKRTNGGVTSSKNYGKIFVEKIEIEKGYSLVEFIKGGMQIQFMVAIDFTGSNGDPSSPDSLHYLGDPSRFNQYQLAIQSIGSILQPYNTDNMIPAYGFGARLQGEVSHCFPLTLDNNNCEVFGVQGLLQAYSNIFRHIKLSGPTLFSEILATVNSIIASKPFTQNSQTYNILLILTDGVINDMQRTVDSIVKASQLPLSIIIVGVGNADFTAMEILDADDSATGLISSTHEAAKNDIVQFVPFLKYINKPAQLSNETLREIPSQLANFVRLKKVGPMKNLQVAGQPDTMSNGTNIYQSYVENEVFETVSPQF